MQLLENEDILTNLFMLVRSSTLALSEMDILNKSSDDVFSSTNRKFVP